MAKPEIGGESREGDWAGEDDEVDEREDRAKPAGGAVRELELADGGGWMGVDAWSMAGSSSRGVESEEGRWRVRERELSRDEMLRDKAAWC